MFRAHLVGDGGSVRLGGVEDVLPMSALDTRTGVGPEPLRRVELLTGMAGRRRAWSLEQKLAIVSEAQGCDNLSELARRHDIRTSQLYTWRRELRYALEAAGTRNAIIEPHFVPVVAHREEGPRRPAMAIEVEVDGAVVRISRTAEARQITAVVQALRQTR